MSRVPMTQAVAADYADAMLVARRAKRVLFLLLLLVLVAQLAIFFVARYVPNANIKLNVATTSGTTTSTSLDISEHKTDAAAESRQLYAPLFDFLLAATLFLGILFAVVLPITLLLIVTIMLVGRLVGVSHVTSAFCWSIVLLVLLFPWQLILNDPAHASINANGTVSEARDVRIPGVLYTYAELKRDFDFNGKDGLSAVLHWSRFVAFPVLAILMLIVVDSRSARGLRFALGEADLPMDMGPPTTANPAAY